MDVNGSRFQLVLGYDNWAAWEDEQGELGSAWNAVAPDLAMRQKPKLYYDRVAQEITLQKRLFRFLAAPRDAAPRLQQRRGAGRDRFGNWYSIGEDRRRIMVNSAGSGQTSQFWEPVDGRNCLEWPRFGEFYPREAAAPPDNTLLAGLAVTEDHYLAVGTLNPPGLLVFDLHAGGPPYRLGWPEAIPFEPFDMAVRPGGGVFVLDRQNSRFWEFDRKFNIVNPAPASAPTPDDFQPQDGSTFRQDRQVSFEGVSLVEADPNVPHDPVAIETEPDGTVLIMDNGPDPRFSTLYRFRSGRLAGMPLSTACLLEVIEPEKIPGFSLNGYDLAFLPGSSGPGAVYVVGADGNQTFAFRLLEIPGKGYALEPLEEFLPMRLFGGKALVASQGRLFYDFMTGWIPLVAQHRPRYEVEAALYSPVLDGHNPDCVWHRLLLDGCIPPGAGVEVASCVSNDPADLTGAASLDWFPEPRLYLRNDGSELPFFNRKIGGGAGNGTWELLFQQAKGRYLRLKLSLSGDERGTPRLRALRAYYPRFSYLERYLPAVYRQDRASASFLDRFLANIEGFYTSLEAKIAAVQVLFDMRSVPAENLDWLASWFGMALDPAWTEAQQRLFIRHIMDFFQYRGTLRGLMMALRLALESCADESIFTAEGSNKSRFSSIRIIEKFRTRQTPGLIPGDITGQPGPQLLSAANLAGRWHPADTGAALHERYRAYLEAVLPAPPLPQAEVKPGGLKKKMRPKVYPLTEPSGNEGATWQRFSLTVLGFLPVGAEAETGWQNFLARRYHTIESFNAAYPNGRNGPATDFGMIGLPAGLPPDGAPLVDWFQFNSVALAMQRTAHRFTVLIAMPRSGEFNAVDFQERVELARRIVELEKPTHTIFDIKYFWAMFRVGEIRLGDGLPLDVGSRSPQLMLPMVLGQNYLAESYLGPGHPQNVPDRQVLGRDNLGGRTTGEN